MNKGIFWIVDRDNLDNNGNYLFRILCSASGDILEVLSGEGISKNGKNYNHKKIWDSLSKDYTLGKPFDYFPRGRVEIANNKVRVYLNPIINIDEIQEYIKKEFGLDSKEIKKIDFISDGSNHYICHLDK